MRFARLAAIALCSAVLTACAGGGGGGGGGGGTTTPLPPPPPPPPPPSIANLTADQSFTGPAASAENEFNLVSGATVISSGEQTTLEVNYDASSRSYTVSLPGRSQTFSEGDRVAAGTAAGVATYQLDRPDGREVLTLVSAPSDAPTSPYRYVGMGYWQSFDVLSNRQADELTTFVYGFDTAPSAMPRTGTSKFAIDVFAASSVPGKEPSVLRGTGYFDVDFMAGMFTAHSYLTETGLITGDGIYGGGIELHAGGLLSSSDAAFSGYVTVDSRNAQLSGLLTGGFYGPNADEVGASFSASNADGATATGSFVGGRSKLVAANLTMDNIRVRQLFFAQGSGVIIYNYGQPTEIGIMTLTGTLHDKNMGIFDFGAGTSSMAGGEFTSASIVASADPNFTVYEKTFGERDVRLELYRPGSSNTELALSYVSLGRWEGAEIHGASVSQQYDSFVYGLKTPERLLGARTGSARYEGVVYGAAGVRTTGAHYDVRGTSEFNVNFSSQSYSGALFLHTADGGGIDFGRYDFSGDLMAGSSLADITHEGVQAGEILSGFYGPTGEEIGGTFDIRVPESIDPGQTIIGGATVARRQ